jgi:hypothetical protein
MNLHLCLNFSRIFLQMFTNITALGKKLWILDGFKQEELSPINWQAERKKGKWKIKTAVSGKTEVLIEEKEVTDTPSGRYPPLCRLPAQLLTPFANTAQQKALMEKRCVSSALVVCRLLETTCWNAVWLPSIEVLYFARHY